MAEAPDGYAGQHFFSEVEALNDQLDGMVDGMREAGRRKAQAEHDYRVALAKRMWELRSQGTPVTVLGDLSRGDEAVALLRLRRDAAESDYWTSQEAIKVGKIRVRTVAEQIAREWGRPSNQ